MPVSTKVSVLAPDKVTPSFAVKLKVPCNAVTVACILAASKSSLSTKLNTLPAPVSVSDASSLTVRLFDGAVTTGPSLTFDV